MQLFDVYPLMNVTPEKASGVYLWDNTGQKYLDLYGGHAVISIGHSHPQYVKRISDQLNKIGFYSNSVQIPLQREMASKLGELSGYDAYQLFLCNSGAEANENALKLASFETGKAGVIAFHGAFHGRTSGAVAITDNQKIVAPFNSGHKVFFEALGDLVAVEQRLKDGEIAAVIIEGIQGVNGIQVAEPNFLKGLSNLTKKYDAKLILDEVQSGYGRTGKFFAHQWTEDLSPDLITIAKGMGNGFPIGGVLIHPEIKAKYGLLGTTFGGNHLACAAGLAVLEVLEEEHLMDNAEQLGDFLIKELNEGFPEILSVRGKGLMVGFDLKDEAAPYRSELIKSHHIFTGSAASKHTIRILPPLSVKKEELQLFLKSLREVINRMNS